MRPTWIVENYTKDKSFIELVEAVKTHGCPVIEVKDDYRKDLFSRLSGPVVFSGSIGMVKVVAADLGKLCHGLIVPDWDAYLCSRYYSRFGKLLFNDRYALLSLSELNRRKFEICGQFGKEAVIFLRPDSGQKPFSAQLVDLLEFNEFYETHKHLAHELVLVSTPKNIEWEGRFVCCGEEIIAQSTYRFQGQFTPIPAVPHKAMEFCREALKVGYYPDQVFCVDVCGIPGGQEFYLMELTSFSTAGLYACDKAKLVERVSEIVTST